MTVEQLSQVNTEFLEQVEAASRRYAGRTTERGGHQEALEQQGILYADTRERVTSRLKRMGADWAMAAAMEQTPDRATIGTSLELDSGLVSGGLLGLERLMGRNDLIGIDFLEAGSLAARSVGRVTVRSAQSSHHGTGFLASRSLLVTNNHVLESAEEAAAGVVEFKKRRPGASNSTSSRAPAGGHSCRSCSRSIRRRSSSRIATSISPWSRSPNAPGTVSRWCPSGVFRSRTPRARRSSGSSSTSSSTPTVSPSSSPCARTRSWTCWTTSCTTRPTRHAVLQGLRCSTTSGRSWPCTTQVLPARTGRAGSSPSTGPCGIRAWESTASTGRPTRACGSAASSE